MPSLQIVSAPSCADGRDENKFEPEWADKDDERDEMGNKWKQVGRRMMMMLMVLMVMIFVSLSLLFVLSPFVVSERVVQYSVIDVDDVRDVIELIRRQLQSTPMANANR